MQSNFIAKMKQFFENPYWIYPLSRVFWKYWWCKITHHTYTTVYDRDIDNHQPFRFDECIRCYHHKDKQLLCESVWHRGESIPNAKRYLFEMSGGPIPEGMVRDKIYHFCKTCHTEALLDMPISPILDEFPGIDTMLVITYDFKVFCVLMREIGATQKPATTTEFRFGMMRVRHVRRIADLKGHNRGSTIVLFPKRSAGIDPLFYGNVRRSALCSGYGMVAENYLRTILNRY